MNSVNRFKWLYFKLILSKIFQRSRSLLLSDFQLCIMNLHDKVAIVSASTSGIGFAIAQRFVREGCSVMVSSRQQQHVDQAVSELRTLAEPGKVLGITCDLLRDEDLQRLVAETVRRFGKLDILVAHTVGNYVADQQLMKMKDDEWDKCFGENVRPARRLAQLAAPHMEAHGGSIIFISHASAYNFPAALGLFPVAKATLIACMKAIAGQVGQFGIRVNCVTPGIIQTKFSERIRSNKQYTEFLLKNTALKRFGEADDVAGVAVFLASDFSSYVSGESIIVAGGPTIAHF